MIYSKEVDYVFYDGYFLIFKADKVLNFPVNLNSTIRDSIQKTIQSAFLVRELTNPKFETNRISKNFEEVIHNKTSLKIKGWAFLNNKKNNSLDSLFIVLKGRNKTYLQKVKQIKREDVTAAFNSENLDNSGFTCSVFTNTLEKDIYKIGLAIKDENGVYYFELFEELSPLNLINDYSIKLISQLPKHNNHEVLANIETVENLKKHILISGWAALKDFDTTNSEIKLIVIRDKTFYELLPEKVVREDVTEYFGKTTNYDHSGFKGMIDLKKLPKGNYQIGVYVVNGLNSGFYINNQSINID